MKILTNDGKVFGGRTPADIVRAMKAAAWHAPERKQAYMVEVIERVETITTARVNAPYDTVRPDEFLRFLAHSGLIVFQPVSDAGSAGN